MNVEHLRRFLVVAEYLNFTAAAEHMYIGQSTLSRQIAALEDELGVSLLIRGARGLQLTEAGQVLYEEGLHLMEHLDTIKQKTISAGQRSAGTINVVSVPAFFDAFNKIYSLISGTYHDLDLRLSHQRYETICRDVDSGKADVGLIYEFLMPSYDSLAVLPIARERLALLCSPRNSLSRQESVCLEELKGQNFLFGDTGPDWIRYRKKNGVSPPGIQSPPTRPIENLILDLQSNYGIALMPRSEVSFQHPDLVGVPLSDEDLTFHVMLVYRKEDSSQKLRRFLSIVRGCLDLDF